MDQQSKELEGDLTDVRDKQEHDLTHSGLTPAEQDTIAMRPNKSTSSFLIALLLGFVFTVIGLATFLGYNWYQKKYGDIPEDNGLDVGFSFCTCLDRVQ